MNDLALKPDSNRNASSHDPSFDASKIHWRIYSNPTLWRPPTDVYETDEAIIVRVEIAGVREEDFFISLENRSLSIRGNRPDTSERRAYYQMEIPFGEFSTEIEIMVPILEEQITAVYQDGFLKVNLPKAQPRRVQING